MGPSPPLPPWAGSSGFGALTGPSGAPSRGPPKKCQKWHFLDPCGAKPRGGGGAPPTTLILLRNQPTPRSARDAAAHTGPPGRRGGLAGVGGGGWGVERGFVGVGGGFRAGARGPAPRLAARARPGKGTTRGGGGAERPAPPRGQYSLRSLVADHLTGFGHSPLRGSPALTSRRWLGPAPGAHPATCRCALRLPQTLGPLTRVRRAEPTVPFSGSWTAI